MLNKIFLTLLMFSLSVTVIGCSSSESESESESKTESEIDALEPESDSMAEAQENVEAEGDVLADLGEDDALKQDEAIDSALPETPVESADAIAEAPPEMSTQAAEPPPEAPVDVPQSEELPPSSNEDLFGTAASSGESTTEFAETPKPVVSLKKIKDMPYTEKGILANTVYVARDGDTLETLEQKTGSSKKDLRKLNGFLKRGVRVGDKIYYNSKSRPTDADRMLTYYEDLNIPPQTYTTKMGENIREISQQLLGHKNSWKEIWATNLDVQSKGALDEGTLLRYWPVGADTGAAPTQTIAQNEIPSGDSGLPETPPPLPAEVAAPGTVEPPPPPPSEPPPPPPAEVVAARPKPIKKAEGGFVIPGLDQDTTFTVIGAVILFAGLAAIMIVRKSRARKLSSHTQTQI